MYVYGLHRNQLFDPPNSSGLRSLTNLEFDGCLKEICSCAGNVLRLCRVWRELPEPETLREEYQENCRAADSQAFTVFAGWKTYFLDPVEAEATRRYGLEHESEESYTPKHSELRTILGDLQEILHTRDEDPKPQMFAISAFEAWFSCFLARTQDIALGMLNHGFDFGLRFLICCSHSCGRVEEPVTRDTVAQVSRGGPASYATPHVRYKHQGRTISRRGIHWMQIENRLPTV